MRELDPLSSAVTGLIVTTNLTVLLFLGDVLAGLPLATFDIFDWFVRALPGSAVTFGIDVMVTILRALGIGVAENAKTAEHIMAVGVYLGTGALGGLGVSVIPGRSNARQEWVRGLGVGIVFGLIVASISAAVNVTATVEVYLGTAWLVAIHALWGASLGWAISKIASAPSRPYSVRKKVEPESRGESVEVLSRRELLVRMGTATAAVTIVGAGLSRILKDRLEEDALANAIPSFSGQGVASDTSFETRPDLPVEFSNLDDPVVPAPGTRSEYTPLDEHYRIDINARPPVLDMNTWRLSLVGLVENPLELTVDDLRNNYEPLHQFVTLSCVSNEVGGDLIGTTLWTGVSLYQVLDDAGILPEATHIYVTSSDGFYESVALDQIFADARIMLAYAWDGKPLQEEHGFPLRIYIPDRYGMKQPKWIRGIEVLDSERRGFWVIRGWDREAIVQSTSVIDTVAVHSAAGRPPLIPVGGIAYTGARGISKVEVRVDDGQWVEAQFRQPLSETTWIIWRFDWRFSEGQHVFAVRCYDGDGNLQPREVNEPHPSGATGVHSLTVDV